LPNIKVKAAELLDTDVQFVSLVDRAANRLPFRITKSEDGTMQLDLYELGRRVFKADPKEPTVAVVMISKTANLEAQVERLAKAGLNMETPDETADDFISYVQPDVEVKDEVVMKLDDEVALVVSHVGASMKKQFESFNFEDTTFKEVFATEGFFLSMHMAADMFGFTVNNIMQKADSPADALAQIEQAGNDFVQFLKGLVGAIPVHAFKADVHILITDNPDVKAMTNVGQGPANAGGSQPGGAFNPGKGTSYSEGPSNSPDGKGDDKKALHPDSTSHDTDDDKDKDKKTKDKKFKKSDDNDDNANDNGDGGDAGMTEKLLGEVTELITSMKSEISGQLSGVTTSLKDVATRLEKVESDAKEMGKTIVSAVGGTDEGGDNTRTKKGDGIGNGAPPLLDTGFMENPS